MRKIDIVIIHCSDSDSMDHDNIETIRKWHVEERGFADIGYHYFLNKAGDVYPGRSEETIGAHCRGHNSRSIGICLSGRNEFTGEQLQSLERLVVDICARYSIEKKDILGHNQLNPLKTCPNFDIIQLVSTWGWH